jgi:quercetin dioxygenase-like cupin family protein
MEIFNESDMIKGWFIGNFSPTALKTLTQEVAVKRYMAGDKEKSHVHKIATEVTFIVEGRVKMNSKEFKKGSIIVLSPGEPSDFSVIEDTITVVVKSPSVVGDKYDLHST